MSSRDLLLEIGLEEMPARFITDSSNQFVQKVSKWLDEKKISYQQVSGFQSPRRLAVLVTGVAESQEDLNEEAKGPAKKIALDENGEWTKAAQGFCRGQGVTVDDIYFKEINGVEYVHVKKFIAGQETKQLLPELKDIITSLTFPKNMRWANEELRYIRPIKWLVALFGEEIIPFSITNVETGRTTFGHRFLGNAIELSTPSQYEEAMLGQHVMVDPVKRKEAIVSQIKFIEEENQWVVPIDESLLEEVTNLIEYPTALFGQFEEEFLQIPEEVLITSMKEHQRYFPVKSTDGKLLNYFITVRNGNHEHLATVAKGNEKVLRARLADAAFFYKEDQKLKIEDALQKLESIVYHEEIGTLAEKVRRVRKLANVFSNELSLTETEKQAVDRAAEICKFDLVTHMVYEFPELQGFMGEKYALQKGESVEVATAINEHYMPRNADDSTPATNIGAVVALAEKLDTIVSFFAIGMIPSGSQDPYALRRQATGIVQTLLNKEWNIPFETFVQHAINLVLQAEIGKKTFEELANEIDQFFKLRLKHVLQEIGIRYDLIDAVLGNKIGAVYSLVNRAKVLDAKKDEPHFKESIEALSRVLNIAEKAENIGNVDVALFETSYEQALFDEYQGLVKKLASGIDETEAFEALISLQTSINHYFDNTMIMVDDSKVRENRLNQMAVIAEQIKAFAKMNEIIVK